MKAKLPIRKSEILNNGEIKNIDSEIEFDVDLGIVSQIRFDSKFPELAKNEDIYSYTKRIFAIEENSASVLISKLKVLYCWFDIDMDFISFAKMFSSVDKEYSDKLKSRIDIIVNAILNSSAEKN